MYSIGPFCILILGSIVKTSKHRENLIFESSSFYIYSKMGLKQVVLLATSSKELNLSSKLNGITQLMEIH